MLTLWGLYPIITPVSYTHLEKSANRLIFTAGSDTVSVNGTDEKMAVSVAMVDNDIYLSLIHI